MKSFRLHDSVDHITERAVDDGAKLVPRDSILLLVRGMTLNNDVPICMTDRQMALNQDLKALLPADDVDAHFLAYWLLANKPQLLSSVEHAGHGTGKLATPVLQSMQIALPPLSEQRAIAAVLGSLDDKIALNRRMNRTLESLARAWFQSWFVDFDPVHANAAGRPTLPPDLAALFPATFTPSPLGDIPEGWEVKPVGDIVDCVGGGTPSTKNDDYWEGGTHHWATPKDLSSLDAPILTTTNRKLTDAGVGKVSSGLLERGTVLMSSRAPVGYLAIADVPVAVNQGFIAMKPTDAMPASFLLNWCQHNMETIKSQAGGTTFAEISKKAFRPIPMLVPPPGVASRFAEIVGPMYARITLNVRESETLAALRDALLPRLLSGELPAPADRDDLPPVEPTVRGNPGRSPVAPA
ncbi:type I restriction enzyme S subunit [Phycisphaera mikurensis]|nr:type I restriction enzyme S subunit [Phycisphaera mikurensis]